MVKKGKLKLALDAHKGVDYQVEDQKRKHKQAEKAKRLKRKRDTLDEEESSGSDGEQSDASAEADAAMEASELLDFPDVILSDENELDEEMGRVSDGADEDRGQELSESNRLDMAQTDATEGDEDDDEEEEEGEEDEAEDIPLSDLESIPESETGDIIPHQRLTINNRAAILKALNSISLAPKSPSPALLFSDLQLVISDEQTIIPSVDDDLEREAAFQKQALLAAIEGRRRLRKEGVPFSRPPDYFAEMVKSDEHMGKVKDKVADEKASKLAAAEARKQRDLRKFGKQVQVEKKQERDRAKRDTLEKIKLLKKKRKSGDVGNAQEEDMFDVALDDAAQTEKQSGVRRGSSFKGRGKRDQKDKKYGYGGKKRFSKSGDAQSSADLTGYSAKRMKSSSSRGTKRLGKSKRMKTKL